MALTPGERVQIVRSLYSRSYVHLPAAVQARIIELTGTLHCDGQQLVYGPDEVLIELEEITRGS